MAQNVTINGADYPSVPSIEIPITGSQNFAKFFETSDADASAADVLAGKVFYNALGKVIGTGSGGGGLEYETGTYSPTADIARPTISFAKTHDTMPIFVAIADVGNDGDTTLNTNLSWLYFDNYLALGAAPPYNSTADYYAQTLYRYRGTSETATSYAGGVPSHPSSESGTSGTYPRYYVTESNFRPYSGSTSRYWRTGRTYKWVAVWK